MKYIDIQNNLRELGVFTLNDIRVLDTQFREPTLNDWLNNGWIKRVRGFWYADSNFSLNKFDVFKQIRVTPKSIILSQKLCTITQQSRAKGRDYYDILFLLQNRKPDMGFLTPKFDPLFLVNMKEREFYYLENILNS